MKQGPNGPPVLASLVGLLPKTLARTLRAVEVFLGPFGLSVADESNQRDAESGTGTDIYEPA